MTELTYVKARTCNDGVCVEVAMNEHFVAIRNSADPTRKIWFRKDQWDEFRRGVLNGEFDVTD